MLRTASAHRTASLSLFLLSFALIVGCSKSEEPPKPAPPAAPPQAAAPAPFKVVRIDLGTAVGADKRVAAPTTTFKPGDTIYASVLTDGASPKVSLAARWTYGDGQLVNESTQTIAPTGPAATEFHIAKADGWPAGNYTLELAANGEKAGTVPFTVVE